MRRRLFFACLLLMLTLPTYAQEVVTFPALSGRYAVGSLMYPLLDTNRDEILTDDPADKRELLLTIYYPAEPFQGVQPVPYIDETLQAGLGVPAELVALIQTQVYGAMPISTPVEDTYPVLIFSPGMYSLPLFYSSLLAEVASHGYIVIAIWHPYSTALTVFPDGHALPVNAAGYLDPYSDAAESQAATERIGGVWLGDVLFVLDQLATIDQLSGRINVTKIGIFGHSFGGGTALEAAYQDARLSAALNMDGPLFGEVTEQAIDKPVMVILADLWDLSISDEQLAETPGLTREAYEASITAYIDVYTAQNEAVLANASTGYLVRVTNANHYTFATDMALLAPLFPNFFPIPTNTTMFGERSIEVIGAYIVAFFDEHLDQARPLLDSRNTTYPEVDLEVFGSAD